MKTAAVLPALGIGDGILMMIASHQLAESGYQVTTFHEHLPELASWFPNQLFEKNPSEKQLIERMRNFDLILAENDNSSRMRQLLSAFQRGSLKQLSIFYPTYVPSKHARSRYDQIFNPNRPMAENISEATASLIGNNCSPCRSNGICPPSHLQHRLHSQRVVIHPMSRETSKNWSAHKFLLLAQRLRAKGFEPHFCVSPEERPSWEKRVSDRSYLPHFSTLADIAGFIYESGFHIGNDSLLGHLASNLHIPTLTIANDEKRMRLWRPGWQEGEVVFPPQWIPNPRIFRWKNAYWQHFLSVGRVLAAFDKLCHKHHLTLAKKRLEWLQSSCEKR